jgi:hypothetical protein
MRGNGDLNGKRARPTYIIVVMTVVILLIALLITAILWELLLEDPPLAAAEEMMLTINGETTISNPSDDDIVSSLAALNTKSRDAFVILESDEMTYMQVSGDRNVGFVLEYQEGTVEKHYQSQRKDIPFEKIAQTLYAYRDGQHHWKEWFHLECITW